ncbi:metallophosphoesterase [Variovorax sp. RTB1]|uniref:metallophosphoesterase n=1 Tax=Variovorax sp. RTB1 TaxID=3048631 RepID=UPI002B22C137|nr:metallophosphoesterase [Variovorax sp. RTB1]MEB0112779.1 metallophosphoesterase [Variovorax sp. RTB1]
MGYDFIGDIHGQAGKLDALLRKLGYAPQGVSWVPPQGRQAIFLGDLIDRGQDQVEVVNIVRSMIDAGHARSVMGNHEFNAIGYMTPRLDDPSEFLRGHSAKNVSQHAEFLQQVGLGSSLHLELVKWFKTLPPALDLGGARVVHAWWHQPYVDLVAERLRPGMPMSEDFLRAAYVRGSPEYLAMEGLTKGLEIALPDGHSFVDHGGIERYDVRTKWWHEDARSYRDVAIVGANQRDRVPDCALLDGYPGAPVTGAPVFIGHYWMEGTPHLQSAKVACLDWSAAKAGPLVAYRWDGEQELDSGRFVAAG